MLIDYFEIEKLPNGLIWLDWCFYAYKIPLIVFILAGFFGWLLYCYIKQGNAVG